MAGKQQRQVMLNLSLSAILATLMVCIAPQTLAQNQSGGQPAPTPTPSSGSSTSSGNDPLVGLVLVAENLIPKLQEAIEGPLVKGLESLAFWIAV